MPNKLVARLCLMYGTPDTADPAAWFAEMDRLVKSYSERELDAAADQIMRSHRGRSFPPVSEMLAACEDVRAALTRKPLRNDPTYPEWSHAARDNADKLIRCSMGRKAAEEGWVYALHSFCRENGRHPGPHEIGGLKAIARGFDDAFRDCCDGRGGLLGDALASLGRSMLERRAELAMMTGGYE